MFDDMQAVKLPFQLEGQRITENYKDGRGAPVKKDVVTTIRDMIFEPSLYPDDDLEPALVFGTYTSERNNAAVEKECCCILQTGTDPATLTPLFLASREWTSGRYSRWSAKTWAGARLGIETTLAIEPEALAKLLAASGAPVSRRMVHRIQLAASEAVRQEFKRQIDHLVRVHAAQSQAEIGIAEHLLAGQIIGEQYKRLKDAAANIEKLPDDGEANWVLALIDYATDALSYLLKAMDRNSSFLLSAADRLRSRQQEHPWMK